MKLQKQLSRKTTEKIYNKYVVTLPPDLVTKLKWQNGTKLYAYISEDGRAICIRPTGVE